MANYPKNVMEFRDQFRGEEECRAYLEQLRWPEGVRCPDCHAEEIWTMRSPFYRCQRCGYDFTVTAGTLLPTPTSRCVFGLRRSGMLPAKNRA